MEPGRGFWGGAQQDGAIVVTSWTTDNDNGLRLIHLPFTEPRRPDGGRGIAAHCGRRSGFSIILTDAGRSEFTGNKNKAVVAALVQPGDHRVWVW